MAVDDDTGMPAASTPFGGSVDAEPSKPRSPTISAALADSSDCADVLDARVSRPVLGTLPAITPTPTPPSFTNASSASRSDSTCRAVPSPIFRLMRRDARDVSDARRVKADGVAARADLARANRDVGLDAPGVEGMSSHGTPCRPLRLEPRPDAWPGDMADRELSHAGWWLLSWLSCRGSCSGDGRPPPVVESRMGRRMVGSLPLRPTRLMMGLSSWSPSPSPSRSPSPPTLMMDAVNAGGMADTAPGPASPFDGWLPWLEMLAAENAADAECEAPALASGEKATDAGECVGGDKPPAMGGSFGCVRVYAQPTQTHTVTATAI